MHQIEQFLTRDLWLSDLATLPVWKQWGFRTLRLVLAVGSEFQHRLLDARAAGLVYTTLLSLVPFLAVMVSVLKSFGAHHYLEPVLAQIVEPLGPSGQQITVRVVEFVNNLNLRVLGVVGIAGLFYTTYSLIGKVEDSFNAIWRVRQGRPWTRKFTDYLSVVLVGPVLVGSAVGLLASIQSHTLVQTVLDIQPFGYVAVWAAQYLPFLLLCGLFTFFYKFLPHTNVHATAALAGGAAAALLWGLAGKAFAMFVASSAKYSAIYSGFAILILFLLWLYVGWLIILIGAQVAFFYQHPSAYEPQYRWLQGSFALKERVAMRMLISLARRYLNAEAPMQLQELASETGSPLPLVDELADLFVAAGLLSRLSTPAGYGFVVPPSRITLEGILNVVRVGGTATDVPSGGSQDLVETVLQRRDQAVGAALSGVTLESLATDSHDQRVAGSVDEAGGERRDA